MRSHLIDAGRFLLDLLYMFATVALTLLPWAVVIAVCVWAVTIFGCKTPTGPRPIQPQIDWSHNPSVRPQVIRA